ncbi:MAG: tetratricopeptide repeat protein [Cyanobacteria bacterium]|nr:tetratricopeptide repeat protein [Cyanobacteriota bacterium]
MRDKFPNAVPALISDVARWLPDFEMIVEQLPKCFRTRMDSVTNLCDPQDTGRQSNVCCADQPESRVVGLLIDLLIVLIESGNKIDELCAEPKLRLLEISSGEIAVEKHKRESEMARLNQCRHCVEYILPEDGPCRFCGGTESRVPEYIDFRERDPRFQAKVELLDKVLAWEIAKRKLDGQAPLPEEILRMHHITEEKVDKELEKLRQNPEYLPLSRWREHAISLGLVPSYYDWEYFKLDDITGLATSLYFEKRYREALIIVDHGLERWKSNPTFQVGYLRLIDSKASICRSLWDFKQERELRELYKAGLEPTHRRLRVHVDEGQKMFRRQMSDPDSEHCSMSNEEWQVYWGKRHEDWTALREEKTSTTDNALLEIVADICKSNLPRRDALVLLSDAKCASQKGEHKEAIGLIENALSLLGDDLNDVDAKAMCLLAVARTQSLMGNTDEANEFYKNAIGIAEDLFETDYVESHTLSTCHHEYASFLRDTGQSCLAAESWSRAVSVLEEEIRRYCRVLQQDSTQYAGQLAIMQESYAQFLRSIQRVEEASQVEAEAAKLREKEAVWDELVRAWEQRQKDEGCF